MRRVVAVIYYSAFGQGKTEDQEIILSVVQCFSRQCSASLKSSALVAFLYITPQINLWLPD